MTIFLTEYCPRYKKHIAHCVEKFKDGDMRNYKMIPCKYWAKGIGCFYGKMIKPTRQENFGKRCEQCGRKRPTLNIGYCWYCNQECYQKMKNKVWYPFKPLTDKQFKEFFKKECQENKRLIQKSEDVGAVKRRTLIKESHASCSGKNSINAGMKEWQTCNTSYEDALQAVEKALEFERKQVNKIIEKIKSEAKESYQESHFETIAVILDLLKQELGLAK